MEAIEALLEPALQSASETLAPDGAPLSDRAQAEQAFAGLIEQIAAQPAAATMCLVEVYAGGPERWRCSTVRPTPLEELAGDCWRRWVARGCPQSWCGG